MFTLSQFKKATMVEICNKKGKAIADSAFLLMIENSSISYQSSAFGNRSSIRLEIHRTTSS